MQTEPIVVLNGENPIRVSVNDAKKLRKKPGFFKRIGIKLKKLLIRKNSFDMKDFEEMIEQIKDPSLSEKEKEDMIEQLNGYIKKTEDTYNDYITNGIMSAQDRKELTKERDEKIQNLKEKLEQVTTKKVETTVPRQVSVDVPKTAKTEVPTIPRGKDVSDQFSDIISQNKSQSKNNDTFDTDGLLEPSVVDFKPRRRIEPTVLPKIKAEKQTEKVVEKKDDEESTVFKAFRENPSAATFKDIEAEIENEIKNQIEQNQNQESKKLEDLTYFASYKDYIKEFMKQKFSGEEYGEAWYQYSQGILPEGMLNETEFAENRITQINEIRQTALRNYMTSFADSVSEERRQTKETIESNETRYEQEKAEIKRNYESVISQKDKTNQELQQRIADLEQQLGSIFTSLNQIKQMAGTPAKQEPKQQENKGGKKTSKDEGKSIDKPEKKSNQPEKETHIEPSAETNDQELQQLQKQKEQLEQIAKAAKEWKEDENGTLLAPSYAEYMSNGGETHNKGRQR